MPTGHTAGIEKGMTFEQFAWSCARSFGALIMMRDDPSDTPIPEKFMPSDYHQKELAATRKELTRVTKLTAKECDAEAKAEYLAEKKRIEQCLKKEVALKVKYEAMLVQVRAWVPPSPEHKEFKKFMIEQITGSIEHDCDSTYYQERLKELGDEYSVSGLDWQKAKRQELLRDIQYHEQEDVKEIERVEGRNRWISQLRNSLK